MVQRCLGLIGVCLLISGCMLPTMPPLMPITPTAPAGEVAPVSPPFRPRARDLVTMAYGETVTTADGALTLTFQALLEDSRCPADVLCAWSGWVSIQLLAQTQAEPAQTLTLTAFTDQEGNVLPLGANSAAKATAAVSRYLVDLQQVTPYPANHNKPTPPADYQIVVQVRKQQGQLPATLEPTAVVTPTALGAGNCPQAQPLPVLCYSNRAITEYAAGARTEAPLLLTTPVTRCVLAQQATGDALCVANFGDGWEMAETDRVAETSTWYEFVPTGSGFWVWDEESDTLSTQE